MSNTITPQIDKLKFNLAETIHFVLFEEGLAWSLVKLENQKVFYADSVRSLNGHLETGSVGRVTLTPGEFEMLEMELQTLNIPYSSL